MSIIDAEHAALSCRAHDAAALHAAIDARRGLLQPLMRSEAPRGSGAIDPSIIDGDDAEHAALSCCARNAAALPAAVDVRRSLMQPSTRSYTPRVSGAIDLSAIDVEHVALGCFAHNAAALPA